MTNVASIKAKLKSQSIASGKTMQELLVAYGLERTIYRLSISRYVDFFILKGGLFLYALYDGNYTRATTDIDLLAVQLNNDLENIRKVFREIFSIKADDPLQFDLNSLQVIPITEFKDYHGVNVSIVAFLDRTRINISIDIGFGDVLFPDKVQIDFPVVLSETSPRIFAYSLASCVSEKFEAIVSLGYDNSRFKDFYDLYCLAIGYDFDGKELSTAVQETFERRHTTLSDIVAFEPGFADDPIRITRWNGFVKKKKAMTSVTLQETICLIKEFLLPTVTGTVSLWSHEKLKWISKT